MLRVTLSSTIRKVRFEELFDETQKSFKRLLENSDPKFLEMNCVFSPIQDGKIEKLEEETMISFENGGTWYFNCYDKQLMSLVITRLREEDEFAFGMQAEKFDIIEENDRIMEFGTNFVCRPGFVIKKKVENYTKYLTVKDDGNCVFNILTSIAKNKLKTIDPLTDIEGLRIMPARGYHYKKKTALINGKKIFYTEGFVRIKGSFEAIKTLINTGIGNSNWYGFGLLQIAKKRETITNNQQELLNKDKQ